MSEGKGRAAPFDGKPGPGRPVGVRVIQVPATLRDMRRVYKSEKAVKNGDEHQVFEGDAPGMSAFRKLYREDLKTFLVQYQKAESEYRKRVDEAKREAEGAAERPAGERDVAGLRVCEMIDKLFEEFAGGAVRRTGGAAAEAGAPQGADEGAKGVGAGAGKRARRQSGKGKPAGVGKAEEAA